MCNKGVIATSKAVVCKKCNIKSHLKCAQLNCDISYLFQDFTTLQYTCRLCCFNELPFSDLDQSKDVFQDAPPPTTEPPVPPFPDFIPSTDTSTDPIPGISSLPSSAKDENVECFLKRGLHFIHLNVRSILPKMSELKIIALKSKAAVISLSETWLDSSVTDSEIYIDNYSVVRNDRDRHGGGVCCYVRNDIAFTARPDLNIMNDEISFLLNFFYQRLNPLLLVLCIGHQNSLILLIILKVFYQTLDQIVKLIYLEI